ncbi:hypothetical protein LUZ62_073137 [Rhynchospora pubera]|uniref:RNase H type-1 domain-containing protein n=1 Tax=Rhynchospora pubera TaxID=906938 RepID=A0AAV8D820_9POAL|nr:hypothetical protein LUZ62_073137 [Rhynchospora pubera]
MRFANQLWAFWKARCKHVYEGKHIIERQVNTLANSYTYLVDLTERTVLQLPVLTQHDCNRGRSIPGDGNICKMDGSYSDQGDSGWAYTLSNGERLLHFGTQSGVASSPLHAEVKALLASLKAASIEGWSTANFLTDCQTLVKVVNGLLKPEDVDWRAYTDILDIIAYFRRNVDWVCFYVPRELL